MAEELALLGGEPVREEPFAVGYDVSTRDSVGEEELEAVREVIESQVLSGFVADSSESFFGGPEVQALEAACRDYFDVEHAVAVNSWTSGLFAAVGAVDLPPGSEVITSPITMSATASAILGNDCVPVFADVDPETANIDPDSVRDCLSDDTGAILPVHIFGYPAQMDELLAIADEHDLYVIEDAAQAIGAVYDGELAGTLGDIGGVSFNVHKHLQTGEGGVLLTDDTELARRCQLIRNHGETVVSDLEGSALGQLSFDYRDIVGQNYRMTELQAAVGVEQLRKAPEKLPRRRERGQQLREKLSAVDSVTPEPVRDGSTHAYYGFPMWYDDSVLDVPLETFVDALEAEGVPAGQYVEPLYNLPLYQSGSVHDNGQVYAGDVENADPVDYPENACPVAERLYHDELLVTDTVLSTTTTGDLDDIVAAISKIEANADDLGER